MADLRIVDAPEIPTENITGEEKLPTGGSGNYSISLDSLADYTKTKKDLADNTSVDGKVNGVRQELDAHIEDLLNPHQVTKGQIGLGNVDNTADADKPVSNSTQAAIISAVTPKADKSSVYTKSETYSRQETQGLVDDKISTALSPISSEIDYIERYTPLPYKLQHYSVGQRVTLSTGEIVENLVPNNNVDPNTDMLGWVKVNNADQIFDESGKTQQEINDKLTSRLLSSFGAVPNDPLLASSNEAAIIGALTLGGDIIVDGYYYTTGVTSNEITNSFALLADSTNSTLSIVGNVNASGWVKLGNVDYIKNNGVNIVATGASTGGPLFTIKDNLVAINKFDFKDFEFNAKFRLFYGEWSKTVDPSSTFYGIRDFNVSDVSLDGTMAFITAVNMQHDLITIDNSKARNVSSLTYSFAVSNDHSFQLNLIAKMKRCEFTNNHAINDDLFFGAETLSSYYAYLLYEGSELLYARNWVEGLKYRNTIALYDVYANCLTLTSTGNTWKNNLCMSATKLNNELLKSKGAYKSRYSANNYILEKAFVEHHAVPEGGDWVTLFQKVEGSDDSLMSIRDCNFEIYKLLGQSSSGHTKNVDIRHNTFKLGVVAANFLAIRNFGTAATTFADANVVLYDNDFDIDTVGSIKRDTDTYFGFTFLWMNYDPLSTAGIYKDIRANKNRFKVNKFTHNFFLWSGLAASVINLDDTTITSFDATATTQIRPYFDVVGGKFGISAKNQVLNITAGKMDTSALSTKIAGTQASSLEFIVDSLHSANSIDIYPPTNELLVRVSIFMDGQTIGMASAIYNFKITSTGIQYTDASGVLQTIAYPSTGTTTINPKVFASFADASLTNVRFIVRDKVNANGVVNINLTPTDVYGGRRYKSRVKIETLPI